LIGERFGNYRVIAKLGEGGMGAVYLAEHPSIGRRVAIKVLKPTYWNNPHAMRRFVQEARSTVNIHHPALVDVMDYGVHENIGCAYMMMEFLSGESMQACLARERGLRPARAANLARQIALGMDVVHRAGIIHRDLKPANVFLVTDPEAGHVERVKILDFGIAKLLATDTSSGLSTNTNMLLGTPHYMAPEQCRGAGRVDPRADIYALGCVFYEMLCGSPPFPYQWPGELIAAHLSEIPTPPRRVDPSIPEAMEALVVRMMAKEPTERPSTMMEVAKAIEALVAPDARVPSASSTGSSAPGSSWDVSGTRDAFPNGGGGATQSVFQREPSSSSRPNPRGGGIVEDLSGASRAGTSAPAVASTAAPTGGASRLRTSMVGGLVGLSFVCAGIVVWVRMDRPSRPTVLAQPAAPEIARPEKSSANGSAFPMASLDPLSPAPASPPTTTAATPAETEPSPSLQTPPAPAETAHPPAILVPPSGARGGIRIAIANARPGLRVEVDGREASLPVILPRDQKTHVLVFSTRNFKTESKKIVADRDQSIVLENRPKQLYVPGP
jgi:serine/threonine-protein kinase